MSEPYGVVTREPLYAAVFEFFSALTAGNAPLFRTATRRPTHWESVAPEDTPALFMRQRNEIAEHRKQLPTKWVFNIELLIYVHTAAAKDVDVIPAQMLNPLLDAIERAFVIDNLQDNAATLGGRVTYAAIDGATDLYLGSLGDDAVAVVPVRILVNGSPPA